MLIVDDAVEVRRLLSHRVPFFGRFTIVGEAEDAEAAVALAGRLRPDLIVLDHLMPGRTGLDAVPDLRAAADGARIVLYTSFDVGMSAARATVDAIVDKAEHPRQLEIVVGRLFPDHIAVSA